MSNKVKDINIKNRTYYFFNDIVNIENFDLNNIKTYETLYKSILIYYLLNWICNNQRILKNLYCKSFLSYFQIRYVNGYFEEINKINI